MPKPRTVREFSDSTFLDLLDDAAQALAGKNGRGPMSRELQGVFASLRASLASGSAAAARRPNARAAWRQLKKSPAWDEFDGLLREIYARGGIPYDAALKAAKGHAKLIGVKFGADELADLAGEWVDKHGAEFVVAIDRTTRRGMRDLIRGAYRLDSPGNRAKLGRSIRDHLLKNPAVGLTPHQMKGFLRDVERQIKSGRIATQKGIDRAWRKRVFQRSRFIAKNEGLINANAAQEAVIGEAVKTGRAEISGYDGVFTSRSGATETGPQAHVGCFPAGTRVVPGGRLSGAMQRRFDGRFVVLETAAGRQLTATANHPILTPKGWKTAHLLEVGDQVVCDRRFPLPSGARMEDQQMPAPIEQVARSAGVQLGVLPVEVPVAAPDFHGDGGGSEVAIVWADGLLGGDSADPTVQPRDQLALGLALVLQAGSFTASRPAALGKRHLPAPNSGMSGLGIAASLFWRELGIPHVLSLAAGPASDALFDQNPADDAALYAESERQGKLRLSSQIPRGNVGSVEMTAPLPKSHPGIEQPATSDGGRDARAAADARDRLAGFIELDQVSDIGGFEGSHDVYNLDCGGWYLAEGIVAQNCICGTRLVRIDGVLFVEWVTRSTSKHQYCIDFDGVLKGGATGDPSDAAQPTAGTEESALFGDLPRMRQKAPSKRLIDAYKAGKRTRGKSIEEIIQRDLVAGDIFEDDAADLFFRSGREGVEQPKWARGWRYGDVPDGGRSTNFQTQQAEDGLSMMQLEGGPRVRSLAEVRGSFDNRPKVVVEGWLNPLEVGGDGEPLLMAPAKPLRILKAPKGGWELPKKKKLKGVPGAPKARDAIVKPADFPPGAEWGFETRGGVYARFDAAGRALAQSVGHQAPTPAELKEWSAAVREWASRL